MKIGRNGLNIEALFDVNSSNELKSGAGTARNDAVKNTLVTSGDEQSMIDAKINKLEKLSGKTFSEEQRSNIEKFVGADSDTSARWNSVGWAIDKDIALTQKNLTALHTTLHEKQNVNEAIETLSDDEISEKTSDEKKLEDILKRYKESRKSQQVKNSFGTMGKHKNIGHENLLKSIEEATDMNVSKKGNMLTFTDKDGRSMMMDMKKMTSIISSAIDEGISIKEALSNSMISSIVANNVSINGINASDSGIGAGNDMMGNVGVNGSGSLNTNALNEIKNVDAQKNLVDYAADKEKNFQGIVNRETAVNTNTMDIGNTSTGIEGFSSSVKISQQTAEKLSDFSNDASDDEVIDFLNEVQDRLSASMDDVIASLAENPLVMASAGDVEMTNDILSDTNFRTFLKTEITEQAYEAKQFFEQNRELILQNLQMQLSVKNTEVDAANLARTIDKLDGLITSNEMSMFLDMKMERDILKMSSELQKARNYLEMGQTNKAIQIIDESKSKLQDMKFMPDEKTIELRAYQRGLQSFGVPSMASFMEGSKLNSGSQILSYFRQMGINHEAELAEYIAENPERFKLDKKDDFRENFKALLLSLKTDVDDMDGKKVEVIENQLNNLTGQQLFNKLEPNKDVQNLFFHVPVQSGEQIKDMKLYVQGRKKGDKMDWENCSLYFSVDLKKYGQTGIHMIVQDRAISMNIKNEHEQAKNIIMPVLQDMQQSFSSIGFSFGKMQFNKMHLEDADGVPQSNIDKKQDGLSAGGRLRHKDVISGVNDANNILEKGFELSI